MGLGLPPMRGIISVTCAALLASASGYYLVLLLANGSHYKMAGAAMIFVVSLVWFWEDATGL
jgi:hypothetical protein